MSHSGQARLVGENLLVWREVLSHESGESIYTEHPIPVPDKGLPGQRQQDLGGAITYARKYCLQGLYGLYADDGLDPDEISYGDAGTSKAAVFVKKDASETVQKVADTVAKALDGEVINSPMPVTVEKPEQRALTEDEKAKALEIIKDKDHGKEWKAEFKERFYPNKDKLLASDIKTLEHFQFLDALQINVPF